MCMHGCNCVSTQLNSHKQIKAHLGDAVGSVLVFASCSKVSFEVVFFLWFLSAPKNYVIAVCSWSLNHVQLCVNPWTVAHQAPLSMGFSRQECWSR